MNYRCSLMILALPLCSCSPKGDDTSNPPEDTGDSLLDTADTHEDTADTHEDTADTHEDTDDTTDTQDTDDTGVTVVGRAGKVGVGVASTGAYTGTEELYLIGPDDQDVCRLSFDVASTSSRSDCSGGGVDCEWAFDVQFTNPVILAESGPGCAALSELSDGLEGSTSGYGYISEYMGHASVLMTDDGSGWRPATFAEWTLETGAFSYDWEYGDWEYQE